VRIFYREAVEHVMTSQRSVDGTLLFSDAPGAESDRVEPRVVQEIEIQIASPAGHVLSGTLSHPGAAPAPVLVVVHGASSGLRDDFLYQHLTDTVGRLGIATLRFDRRGEGFSTGTITASRLEDLADDVAMWVEALRSRSDVDPDRIGLWCFSQGGWIGPQVAAADSRIWCLVGVGVSGVTAGEQMGFATERVIRTAGYDDRDVEIALRTRAVVDGFLRGRVTREEAIAAVESVRYAAWFELIYVRDPASGPDPGYARFMDFDVRPFLRRLALPVLLVFGEEDRWIPVDASIDSWRSEIGLKATLSVERIAHVGHALTRPDDPRDVLERGEVSHHYEDVLTDWLSRLLRAGGRR
jgi:pimeloyl-ACP methyl ester carboxylesterase